MRQETDNTGDLSAFKPVSTRGWARALAAVAVSLVVAATVALLRNNGPPLVDILYAEDGTQFYSTARTMGLSSIFTAYAGYVHLVPRIASEMLSPLPIGMVAAAYSVSATVLVAFLALYTFFASRVLLESWPSRVLLASAMVVPPLAGETVANLANLHWYLMFAAFWAIISNPRNSAWAVAGAAVGATAALSDPLTALLLPAAALAVYRYRSRLHGFVVGSVALGLAIQVLVVLGAAQRSGNESSWADLPVLYAFRVAGGITVGELHLTSAWLRASWAVPVVAIVVATFLVMRAIASTQEWQRVIVIATALNSIAFFAIPLLVRGTRALIPVVGQPPVLGAGRYTLVPGLFLVVCLAVLLDRAVTTRTTINVWIGGIAAAWLVGVIATNFFITPLPNGPSWEEGVEAARRQCSSEPIHTAEVVIAPSPSWSIQLSCTDL